MDSAQRPVCRICYESQSATKGRPIVVCDCKGAYAYVHRVCISDWMQATESSRCDICNFAYIVRKRHDTFGHWYRSQEKNEEYKITLQTAGMYLFNLMVAAVLFYATYGRCL